MPEFNIDELLQHHNPSYLNYLAIDFAPFIVDLMQTISVLGSGIVVVKHGNLELAASSSHAVAKIKPHHFYTQQTIQNAHFTEMTMPFGQLKRVSR